MNRFLPILTVSAALVLLWYGACVLMNAQWTYDQAARDGRTVTLTEVVVDTMTQARPVLPPPHQIIAELQRTIFQIPVTNKQSLVYHSLITLKTTFFGFLLGMLVGIAMAIAIVKSRAFDLGVMPWAIISQTVPIVALAPMIVVLSSKAGIDSKLVPRMVIAAYLGFFPVLVGMVKGLRSPDPMQLDQMRTWNANATDEFLKLRLPASFPYLIATLKVALAAALVGAIVGELPTSGAGGLGARMLVGSQFGPPIVMWAALLATTIMAAVMILSVGWLERVMTRAMGGRS